MITPLLSICIPTYNRAVYLDATIDSIVKQKRFSDTSEIEIVISDNCSPDNTMEIFDKYYQIYGDKIRYVRNTENIKDSNFEKVLGLGKGKFLKLNNDTLIHKEDTLDKIIETINQNIENNDIIFFPNGMLKKITISRGIGLDYFVKNVSFYSTWIAGFGIWKKDYDLILDFSKNAGLQLVQTDILFRLISSGRPVYIDNSELFNSIAPGSKGGYNFYQVFVANYLGLLEDYRLKNLISANTIFNEKSKLLLDFVIPWTILMWKNKTLYSFKKEGAIRIILLKYWYHPILYVGFIYFMMKMTFAFIKVKFKIDRS